MSYLHMVRETVVGMMFEQTFDSLDIEFENVQFHRATHLSTNTDIELTVVVQIGTGAFEVTERTTTVITGTVRALIKGEPITDLTPWLTSDETNKLDQKDFYKELRLRGYQYAGLFKSVVEVQSDGLWGKIKWQDNWPAFMDCMLQTNILAIDSRSLHIPISIRRIRINTQQHLQAIAALDPQNCVLEVKSSKALNMVTCGGIEIEGLECRSISRRSPPGIEVLESHKFVPFNCGSVEYQKNEAIAIFLQIGLENLMQSKLKIVEIDEIETEEEEEGELSTLIQAFDEVLVNTPMVTADLLLLCKKKCDIDHVTVENAELNEQTDCHFIVASNWLNRSEKMALAQKSLVGRGFLVLREDCDTLWNDVKCPEEFRLISMIKIPGETLILLQRTQPIRGKSVINIESTDMTFGWLGPLKKSIENSTNGVIVAVERNSASGLLGLINCIRREPNCSKVIRGVMIADESAPQFDLDHPMYAEQLSLDLAVNVYKNGQWGSYRHIALSESVKEECHTSHCFAHVKRIGDLSSFEWMSGWLNASKCEHLMNIHYAAINFRDVVLATGRIPIEAHTTNRVYQQCVLGFECSGVNASGERMMGILSAGAFATQTGISHPLNKYSGGNAHVE